MRLYIYNYFLSTQEDEEENLDNIVPSADIFAPPRGNASLYNISSYTIADS